MTRRHSARLVAVCVAALCMTGLSLRTHGQRPQRPSLDSVLIAYRGGDLDIVKRTFVRSPDLQRQLRFDRPRELERWLGPFDRSKALLLLEFARTASEIAPQQHVAASLPASGELDARLKLARAVAQERRCWGLRPSLEPAADAVDALLAKAGMRVPDDLSGPFRSQFGPAWPGTARA